MVHWMRSLKHRITMIRKGYLLVILAMVVFVVCHKVLFRKSLTDEGEALEQAYQVPGNYDVRDGVPLVNLKEDIAPRGEYCDESAQFLPDLQPKNNIILSL